MMQYIEVAKGNVKNRNHIMELSALPILIENARVNGNELYYSVWNYDEDILKHFENYKSIRSYRGRVSLPFIIFDIDKGKGTDDFVLERTQQFCNRLDSDWDVRPEELKIYYSGRGYHLYMPNYFKFEPSENIIQEVKNTIKEHFMEVDLAVYAASSLIRAEYSLNAKTKRFKIPLSVYELYNSSAAEIMLLAESNNIRSVPIRETADRDFSGQIVKATVEREALTHRDEPTRVVTCMQTLFNKGATVSARHDEMHRLISAWRRQGLAKAAVMALCKQWCTTLSDYEIERQVNYFFEHSYKYGCNDWVMMKYCDSKCIHYVNKDYTNKVSNVNDIESMMVEHARGMDSKKYIDIDKILKLPMPYRVYEGELVVIWGDTKIGKSMLIQNIMVKSTELKWLYMSLENGIILDSRRLLQIAHNFTKEQVITRLGIGETGMFTKLSHIQMSETSVTVDGLRKVMVETEVDAVVVDTVDQLGTNAQDYTTITEKLAVSLRNLSRDLKKIIILVHHISKRAAEDSEGNRKEMTIHSGKGSSALEQKADKIISIEGNQNTKTRIIRSLGARDESPFIVSGHFDVDTFRLRPMDEIF